MTPSRDDLAIKELLYDSEVTRVQRGVYKKNIPVIIKSTAQEIPDEALIGQYSTSFLAQNKVDHPAVNRVIKEMQDGAGRSLVLEDIGGVTVKAWIDAIKAQYPRWPLEDPALFYPWILRLLRWSVQLAKGVSACHQQNIIHNDINPANVVVNPETNQVQLIDFGAAFPDGSNINEWTVVEQHRTLTYISPEQTGRLNRNIDYRSDYYALGATLYQLLSSQPPFVANDLPELINCHIARHPVPLDRINPLIPESLSALVAKLMAKAPEDRYQNGRCLIQDLEAIEHAVVCGIPFPLSALGKNDVPEQLLTPAKLYGREQEVATLRKALNSHHDKPALIAVEGEAGSGKTTLITEAISHDVYFTGQLLAGKSDAYNKKPHGALSQALAKSVGMLLSLSDDQFVPWRLTLLEALNYNPHTLISLCPELIAVFETAEFPEKPPLYNADIQLKLHTSLFLQHLSALDPILLFIDDVQWCDGPSIALLEALINAKHPRITVMVTCRSEEVDTSPPYSVMKKTLQESGVASVIIELENLDVEQIEQLLLATFHIEKARLGELANILLEKTLGNPLFVHEFLKAAHHANHKTLYYNNQRGRWDWDKQRLKQIATSGNVAVLLIDALHQQDAHTQDLLQWAACIGTRFNETLLARVTKTTTANIKLHLNAVYKQGYIHRIADQQGSYAFNHDRIRQAYYELLPRENTSQRHWVIGRICGEDDSQFKEDPLPHFLVALRDDLHPEMLCDEATVARIIRLFYDGGLLAKEKTANDIALQYIQCAIHIAEEMSTESSAQLAPLLLLQGELGYLVADTQLAGDSFNRYRLMNHDVMLQAASFSQQAPLAFLRGDIDGSINCSLNCFQLLGVDTPSLDEDIANKLQYQKKIFESFGGLNRISNITVSDESLESGVSILQSTAANMVLLLGMKGQYQWGEWFGLVGINDFLSSGFSKSMPQLLSLFDCLIFSDNEYKYDQRIVDWTLGVAKYNCRFPGVGFVFSNVGGYSGRYSRSMSLCLEAFDVGAKASFDQGDYLSYLACLSNKVVVAFS
ncbi:MAG: AAA family ATPase, partial [Pseudomonadales bacterium]|nr:AAA family ATPase [Pseudomonadales bacterium]